MTTTEVEIRTGAYYDSVILMQLQRSLAEQPGVLDAGVVMGTQANKDVLAHSDLLAPQTETAGPDDLVIVVRGQDASAAQAALEQVDELLQHAVGGVVWMRSISPRPSNQPVRCCRVPNGC